MTMMKTTAAVLALATAATGFAAPAFARDHRDDNRWERRDGQRDGRWDRGHVRTQPDARWNNNWSRNDYRVQSPRYVAPRYVAPSYVAAPRYTYNYGYAQPRARYWVGGYVPTSYRQPYYYVNDWRSYNGLYSPPYGYQWVRTDTGDFLLMALATGLIANLILSR